MAQIDFALKQGAENIILTGGEVTIRKDFPVLINKCAENRLQITVQTNGRTLSQQNVISAVDDIDDIKFVVALHGASAEVHDDITRVTGSFEQTCRGIKTMCDMGKMVVL